jgi:hypothetical protein
MVVQRSSSTGRGTVASQDEQERRGGGRRFVKCFEEKEVKVAAFAKDERRGEERRELRADRGSAQLDLIPRGGYKGALKKGL